MRWRIGIVTFLLLAACTAEETAFPKIPPAPKSATFTVATIETRTNNNGKYKSIDRRFTLSVKPGFAPETLAAKFDELLGASTTNILTYDHSGVALTEQDGPLSAWVFSHPVSLVRFPLVKGKTVTINSKAQSIDAANTIESHVLVRGTVRNDHVGLVHVKGHALRAMVVDVRLNVTHTDITPSDTSDSGVSEKQTRHEISGELWFVPSYSLFVGGNMRDEYFGSKSSGADNYTSTIKWQITNLPS